MVADTSFLYVEDDPRSREVMELLMTKVIKVKELVVFEDSLEFDNRINAMASKPEVVLLDIHVTPHDGFEMLNFIRRNPDLKDTKVIALTASVMNEEVEAMRARGFDGAIAKPLSMASFPGLIERVVAGDSVWHIV